MLVGNLAQAGVRYAALTDHDTVEGLLRFQEALKKRGISYLPGVEITTQFHGREAHLLGYGFDPDHPELTNTLLSLRQIHGIEIHSIAGSLRKAGSNHLLKAEGPPAANAAPNGILEIEAGIELIHRAGGCVFLAHPFLYETNLLLLDGYIVELKTKGLDGIEALYSSFSDEESAHLVSIARKHDLLVCAGTDFHGSSGLGSSAYGIEMPWEDWIKFREIVFTSPNFSANTLTEDSPSVLYSQSNPVGKRSYFRRRYIALRIFLPTFIAIALFLGVFWGMIKPSFERTLLQQKREMIHELTNSAWSILASYQVDEQSERLTRSEAQALAVAEIADLRYGSEAKDYFWIQDMQPRMIMHPYRSDLNGQELTNFKDTRGVPIFVEFAALVRREGEGYIDYVWQWKDDPQRLEAKESYVKGFAPWGWIIGTGIYIDDVNEEIARIEQNLINTSLIISGIIVLLLLFVIQQSVRIEKERQEVVDSLRESTERYHSLVEATTEGTLLVLDDHCRYANHTFLDMLGYSTRQLEFLELTDLLPNEPDNEAVRRQLHSREREQSTACETMEGCLMRKDGSLMECILTLNSIQIAGHQGYILSVKDIARPPASTGKNEINNIQHLPIGIFKARARRQAVFLETNQVVRTLLNDLAMAETTQPALADLFSDPAEYENFFRALQTEHEIRNQILHIETSDAKARYLSLSARLVQDAAYYPAHIVGTLEDVTTTRKHEAGREALIEKLQASLLFLHEPLSNLGRDIVICKMDTSITQLARLMTERMATAALVASETSAIIGIVTDHDLRARALAENIDLKAPIYTIMSAPVTKIHENAHIYEALMCMEEKGVRHLAVEDQNGQIINVIDSKSLIQFQRYGPIVLTREIARAKTSTEVAKCCERTNPLVKSLLDSSDRPRHVTKMLSSICDSATERLIQLAVDELGPPPVPFAFIAMGSQGRQEQTLVTDQDNGIIISPHAHTDLESTTNYFLKLGERVCHDLDRAGYPLCRGQVMANNPRWCRTLSGWISGFDEWVHESEPQEIIDLSIFFDYRMIFGDLGLVHELRQHIHQTLQNEPAIFHHLSQNALMFKPPFRLLGNIYLSGGATEHSGEINLKDAMMPIVSFARLYALRHQLNQTHTLERIEALSERNIISPSTRDEITTAYDFLMQLRLQNQLAAIQPGQAPQNIIRPKNLGYIQQELLKGAFAQIAAVQKKIHYDFLGGL
jgi:PAS domain S-box-containing protein